MGWTYEEYLEQPEWFVVALIKQFARADKEQEGLIQGLNFKKK